MIEELSIRDLGVIGQARLPLGAGFTAVTGETGAGKTMVVTALALLLGERADAGAIRRAPRRRASKVVGSWPTTAPSPSGFARRAASWTRWATTGRSSSWRARCRPRAAAAGVVGGRSTPVGVLAELGDRLVVVHGQSDQLRLKSAAAQRDALDGSAGAAHRALLAAFGEAFRDWRVLAAQLQELTDRSRCPIP